MGWEEFVNVGSLKAHGQQSSLISHSPSITALIGRWIMDHRARGNSHYRHGTQENARTCENVFSTSSIPLNLCTTQYQDEVH
jgi:hypothetical protein